VRGGQPLSHQELGWDGFTRAVMRVLDKQPPIVFVLWGSHAKKYRELITDPKHLILTCAHPSPLSAHNGFFGCNHFKRINEFLASIDKPQISW